MIDPVYCYMKLSSTPARRTTDTSVRVRGLDTQGYEIDLLNRLAYIYIIYTFIYVYFAAEVMVMTTAL